MNFQIALDYSGSERTEEFWPEKPNYPCLFRLAIRLDGQYTFGSVGMAATVQDFRRRNESLATGKDQNEFPFHSSSDFFLVDGYGWQSISEAVSPFFESIVVGNDLQELCLKSYCVFADEAFWEDYPPRIDMDRPAIHYSYEIVGLYDEEGGYLAWKDLPEKLEIKGQCRIRIDLKFPSVTKEIWFILFPTEELYAWMDQQPRPSVLFPGRYGLEAIKKDRFEELIRYDFDHMEGGSVEEILLRWAVVAHVPELPDLLRMPLGSGPARKLDPIGIQKGRQSLRN